MKRISGTIALAAALLGATAILAVPRARAAEDWNDTQIDWKGYEEGLAAAKESNKPVCLIFYTEWCPHCKHYSQVFHDPKVVEQAKDFVMIRLNKDHNGEISKKYTPDGEYIPRTYFLSSAGVLDASIHAPRDRFLYFYDEMNPASVLAGMKEAREKLALTSPPAAVKAAKKRKTVGARARATRRPTPQPHKAMP